MAYVNVGDKETLDSVKRDTTNLINSKTVLNVNTMFAQDFKIQSTTLTSTTSGLSYKTLLDVTGSCIFHSILIPDGLTNSGSNGNTNSYVKAYKITYDGNVFIFERQDNYTTGIRGIVNDFKLVQRDTGINTYAYIDDLSGKEIYYSKVYGEQLIYINQLVGTVTIPTADKTFIGVIPGGIYAKNNLKVEVCFVKNEITTLNTTFRIKYALL